MKYDTPQTQHASPRHLAAFVPVSFFSFPQNDPRKVAPFFPPCFTSFLVVTAGERLCEGGESFSATSFSTSSTLNGNYRGRRRGRRGASEDRETEREVNFCGDVSDTPAYYHANCTVNVIIGTTNLAGSNYRGEDR